MLFSDPKWGNGCLALIGAVAGLYLLGAVMRYFGWTVALPAPAVQVIWLLVLVGIARFILNQIFD